MEAGQRQRTSCQTVMAGDLWGHPREWSDGWYSHRWFLHFLHRLWWWILPRYFIPVEFFFQNHVTVWLCVLYCVTLICTWILSQFFYCLCLSLNSKLCANLVTVIWSLVLYYLIRRCVQLWSPLDVFWWCRLFLIFCWIRSKRTKKLIWMLLSKTRKNNTQMFGELPFLVNKKTNSYFTSKPWKKGNDVSLPRLSVNMLLILLLN